MFLVEVVYGKVGMMLFQSFEYINRVLPRLALFLKAINHHPNFLLINNKHFTILPLTRMNSLNTNLNKRTPLQFITFVKMFRKLYLVFLL